MKKVICFSLIVMYLALAGYTLVKADDVVVNGYNEVLGTLTHQEISKLTYSTMLIEYLRQGGSIDVKNTSDNYSFDDLIDDFGNFIDDVIDVGSGLLDFVNPFQTEVEYHGLQPIRGATPGVFNLLGLLPFYALNQDDEAIEPTPDVNYMSYINTINGHDLGQFFWYNMNGSLGDGLGRPSEYTNIGFFGDKPFNYSWCWINGGSNNIVVSNGYNTGYYVYPLNIQDVNIVSNNGTYSFTVNAPIITGLFGSATYGDTGNRRNGGTFEYRSSSTYWLGGHSDANQTTFTLTVTNQSLQTCFNYLTQYMRNVNIFVDGVPWATVSNGNVTYNIEISTGTTVPIKDGTGKVEWLYDYEIYFDIDRIQDDLNTLLHLIKNTPNTPTIITFKDIEDCIVDVDGQPAIAVKIVTPDKNIDEEYIKSYGPIIPAFLPLFTPVIDDVDIITIADNAVSPIPDDLLEVFGYMFMGVLFVGFIHRLLE